MYHADGEHPPSEALNLLGRRCGTCTGLMLTDNHDTDTRTCANCGRSDFSPRPEIQAEEPTLAGPDPIIHHHLTRRRAKAVRGMAMPEGRVAIGV